MINSITEISKINWITVYEKRFEGIKNILPKDTRFGYITDNQAADIQYDFQESKRYYLAQYAMAPVILEYGRKNNFVIGNFENGAVLLKNREK
jgi:hypothetical protein